MGTFSGGGLSFIDAAIFKGEALVNIPMLGPSEGLLPILYLHMRLLDGSGSNDLGALEKSVWEVFIGDRKSRLREALQEFISK